jgi:Fic family protein
MTWNWQQSDWPRFSWKSARFEKAEHCFLLQSGIFVGTVNHLADEEREQITIEAISNEALTTSEIEGEMLNRDSVQSSVRRQFGLTTDNRRVQPAEQGIAEMMVNLYRSFAEPLTHEMLFEWHRMLTNGRRDLRDIGRYRTHAEPMQVVSGAIHAPQVHFEAPPSSAVPSAMVKFIEWFERTAPSGRTPLDAVTRAGIAHLYFESIHPFEDGNGRIGRAISEKALAQSLGRPTLTALAATILSKRKSYYAALEAANRQNEITPWLAWFGATVIEAQRRTIAQVEFVLQKAKLFDRFRGQFNERQEKVFLRLFREGPSGFKGGLSASNYRSIAQTTTATATRDLADLVEKGALTRTGELRHTRYHLPVPLAPIPAVTINENGDIV